MTFPVDFFEHNQQLTEVEFGGNDLLQVYNGQQIKHRLNSTGMYVANTKVSAFHFNFGVTRFLHACIHSLIHTYIHTYMHAYITKYSFMHTLLTRLACTVL